VVKKSLILAIFLSCVASVSAQSYTFSISMEDSTVKFKTDGHKCQYFLDAIKDEVLFRTCLPGNMAIGKISVAVEYNGVKITVPVKTRLERGVAKNTLLYFSLTDIVWEYQKQTIYKGILPEKYTEEQYNDLLLTAYRWQIIVKK